MRTLGLRKAWRPTLLFASYVSIAAADARMEQLQGCVFCDAALTGVPAARTGAGPARVVLPASALNAAGLSAGEVVLLAVVQVPDEGSSGATPDAPRGRQSAATPPRTPPSGSRGNARLSVGAEASPLVFTRRRVADDGVVCAAEADTQPPGERLLAACIWPSQQLAVGTASASAAVLEAASWPPTGAVLRVYPLSAPGSKQRVRARVTEAASLTLTVCEPGSSETAALPDAVPGSPLTPQSSLGASASASKAPGSPAYKASAAKSLGNFRCARLHACLALRHAC